MTAQGQEEMSIETEYGRRQKICNTDRPRNLRMGKPILNSELRAQSWAAPHCWRRCRRKEHLYRRLSVSNRLAAHWPPKRATKPMRGISLVRQRRFSHSRDVSRRKAGIASSRLALTGLLCSVPIGETDSERDSPNQDEAESPNSIQVEPASRNER